MTRLDPPPTIREVLRRFGAAADGVQTVRRPSHAAIAQVWLLDERLVLRARARTSRTVAELRRELALLERVRAAVPYALPDALPAATGERYVEHGDAVWTLYPRLPGEVVRPWQLLHRAPEAERRRLVVSLRRLHDATRGRFGAAEPRWVSADVGARLEAVRALIPPMTRRRVERALSRVEDAARALPPEDCAFVHGDWHWGNLLVDGTGEVTGLLDLDWCRIAHPLEDLAYTTMMLVRDYDAATPRLDAIDDALAWYDAAPDARELLGELLVLYTLFDVHLFWTAAGLTERERFLDYQRDLLERICAG